MSRHRLGSRRARLLAVVACCATVAGHARAQSLIAGIPSTDVTPRGRTIVAHESQLSSTNLQRGWTSFTFMTHGLTPRTEFAASLLNVSAPASGNRAISAGIKHAWPLGDFRPDRRPGRLRRAAARWDVVLASGAMALQSLDRRGTGAWLYGAASVRVPVGAVRRRPRLTIGPSWGTRQQFGRTARSLMVGVEQPVTRWLNVVGDWYSGRHDLAATIAALQVMGPDGLMIIAGAKLPNRGVPGGKRALMFEIAKEF